MVAIAIFSTDPARRRSLEQLLRKDSTFSIVGVLDDPAAIPPRSRLILLRSSPTAIILCYKDAEPKKAGSSR
jgi:DNA-binding NarL/FixJ family response regulator